MRFLLILFLIYQSTSAQQRYDIIIDEIMADPSPQVGLPNAEYLELKNISATPFNLNGFRIYNDDQVSRITSDFILLPDSFVILCSSASLPFMIAFGPSVVLTNFSALNNSGAVLSLMSREGTLLHAVHYASNMYGNEIKGNGGWSLEMIDTRHACISNENWKASIAISGGTPGKKNAVNGISIDNTPPVLTNAYALDSLSLILIFNETLDSSSAVLKDNYVISAGTVIPVNVAIIPPLFNSIIISTTNPWKENLLVTILIKGIPDCTGNVTDTFSVHTGMAGRADQHDIIINELLFNPKAGGDDFIELYNRSKKIIDLKTIYLSSKTTGGNLNTPIRVVNESSILLPDQYTLLTRSISILKQQFYIKHSNTLIEMSTLPSLPDDKGNLVILNASGDKIDELQYDEDWHFKLLDNKEGVSLERISAEASTQDARNWHSASTTAGFATPGYKNSQTYITDEIEGSIKIDPGIFSPDNNGTDDFTTISYRFPSPGNVMTLTIFNTGGTPVRLLARNMLCGITGYVRWDGLDEQHQMLSRGIYILLIEYFNLEGRKFRSKKTIIISKNM